MKQVLAILGLIIVFACTPTEKKQHEEPAGLPLLKVSENGRFLETEDGDPFFWLGDTGWLLFSKLTREEAEKYLDNRVEKGFNVIQVMVVHSISVCNIYGDSALVNGNVAQPNTTPGSDFNDPEAYDFWDNMDYVINLAEKKGLYMALVPVWGTNVKEGGVSREQADVYSTWLAKRYAGKSNIIWLNGGDTHGNDSTSTWNIIGENIHKYAPNHLETFHPFGRTQSSLWFHNADWLDFNMFQSGHRRYDQDDTEKAYGQDNYKYVRDNYAMVPPKPTIDGEPSYEGIPQGLHDPAEPFWNDADLRRYAYWSVFAGGFGFTYGNSAVMQFYKPSDETPAYGAREYWTEAIDMPGAGQMQYLKTLMLSKPYFERVPDQSLIAGVQGEKYDYLAATRGENYAMIYTYNGRNLDIAMGKIAGERVNAWWFNPRNGELTTIGSFENTGEHLFDPPGEVVDGNDWVLVLNSVE
ncbi:glycoside hydrolase family 140 protein [Maribellus sediminis]|uniref:glycoside hydrolase family 140 protein n=1 Tax=Maribellus sediminis TaxID=2696285 RepID=UPI001430B6E6|nr:glycoside hydrolase family 140 protein [Maribellus sediminis]